MTEPAPEQPQQPAPPSDLDKLFNSIAPLHDVSKYMKMLVFGPPGSGKTTFAGGAPDPVVIDVDRGAVSLAGTPAATRVMQFKSIRQLELFIEYAKNPQYKDRFKDIQTIVIDTLSEVHKRGLTEIVLRENRNGLRDNPYLNIGDDHQENNERIRRIVSNLRDLDKHIIVNCHTKRLVDKDNAVDKLMPDFSEKLVNTCNAVFDIVGYLYTEADMEDNIVRKLRVSNSGAHEVKTRIRTLPPVISNPTWPKIYAAYMQFVQQSKQG